MKKIKVVDLQCCNEEDKVRYENVEDVVDFKDYYDEIVEGSLDEIIFAYEDIDQSIFIIDDGGEAIKTKYGDYVRVCWRCDLCRVWIEDDEDTIKYLNSLTA